MVRHALILVVVLSLQAGFHADAQTVPPKQQTQTEIVRFVGLQGASSKTPKLKITKLDSDKGIDLPLEVSPRTIEDLTDLKNGDYLTIDLTLRAGNKYIVTAAEPYDLKPGEDEKDVYVFDYTDKRTVGRGTMVTLKVSKFGKDYEFAVPPTSREKFQSIIDELATGDSVFILALPGKPPQSIKELRPYEPPDVGQFVKMTEITEGKSKHSAMILADVNGVERTFLFPPAKKAPFLAKAKPFKEGDTVQFRSKTDDKDKDVFWMDDFKAAPKDANLTRFDRDARNDKDSKNDKDDEDDKDDKDSKKDVKKDPKKDPKK